MKNDYAKRVITAGVLLIIAIAMSVASWILLPDAVAMQFKGLSTGAPAFPKFLAILIAFGFSAVFSVLSVKYEEGKKYALIGFGLHILYWVCNL